MNTKDFIRLGVPLGEASRRATDFIGKFILAGGDKTRLKEEVKAIIACRMKMKFDDSNMSSSIGSGVLAAAHFAARKHKGQRRKDPEATPYINHPLAVAELLSRVGGVTDVVTLQAALLHDTIEDTDTRGDELETSFGKEVRCLVEEVTDDKLLPKAERKRLQIEHASTLSPRARLIKLADKICNVADLQPNIPAGWSVQRKIEYLDWAGEVVDRIRGSSPSLEAQFDEIVSDKRRMLSQLGNRQTVGKRSLDATQSASAAQFDRQSDLYGKSHILADTQDVAKGLAGVLVLQAAPHWTWPRAVDTRPCFSRVRVGKSPPVTSQGGC